MKTKFRLLTFRNIPVNLHITFILFFLWIILSYTISGMPTIQIFWSVVFITGLFLSVILHEFGHSLTALRFGIRTRQITLYPIGGIADIEKIPENPRQEFLIAAAGPMVSFLLAFVFLFLSPQHINRENLISFYENPSAEKIIFAIGAANLILGSFNLLPAFPMDGGRILRSLLAMRLTFLKATAIAATIGRVFAILMIITGVMNMNFILALIGLFILIFSRAEESMIRLKSLLKGVCLGDVLMHDFHRLNADMTVNEAVNILENDHSRSFILMRNGVPAGSISRATIIKSLAAGEHSKLLIELESNGFNPFQSRQKVEDVMNELGGNSEKLFPVFDHDIFLGVISFENIIEHMAIHKACEGKKPVALSFASVL